MPPSSTWLSLSSAGLLVMPEPGGPVKMTSLGCGKLLSKNTRNSAPAPSGPTGTCSGIGEVSKAKLDTSEPAPTRSWYEVCARACSEPVKRQPPPVDVMNWPLTLALSTRPSSVPVSEPLPLPVSARVSDLNVTLLTTALTLPLSSPVPVKSNTYCTGSSSSVPVSVAWPVAEPPCWLVIANVPVRLTEPVTSQESGGVDANQGNGPDGRSVWLKAALADLNLVRFFWTEMTAGALLRPLLPLSASGLLYSATADR